VSGPCRASSDELEVELRRLGLPDEKISVRMTGCPNGCARLTRATSASSAAAATVHAVSSAGHVLGHRLNYELADLVPRDRLVPTLVPSWRGFRTDRRPGECFGDWCQRLGPVPGPGASDLAGGAEPIFYNTPSNSLKGNPP